MEEADQVFDVLVAKCGASNSADVRASFIAAQGEGCREYRFLGSLGWGGKFHSDASGWWVSCYREDDTERRSKCIKETNLVLALLLTELKNHEKGSIQP